MAAVNVALALTLMPVSLCLGFTAATISFTAWNIVVPLLLNGFGLDLGPTLFVSVMLDVFNCAVLTVAYGYHGKVDWRLGLTFGAVSAAAALVISNVMVNFLEEHQEYLKGVMYVVPFVLAVGFLAKGVIVWRRRRLQKTRWGSIQTAVPSNPEADADADSEAAFALDPADVGDAGHDDPGVALPMEDLTPAAPAGTASRAGPPPSAGGEEAAANGPATPSKGDLPRAGSSSMLRNLTPSFAQKPRRAGYAPLLAGADDGSDDSMHDGTSQDESRSRAAETAADAAGAPPAPSAGDPSGSGGDGGTGSGLLVTSPRGSSASLGPTPTRSTSAGYGGPSRKTSVTSLIHEAATVITVPPLEKQHMPFWSVSRPPTLKTSSTSRWEQLRVRFQPDDDLLKRKLSKRSIRMGLMGVFAVIMGSLSGALYVGGGMGFALAIASFFKANVRISTGTGCFICFLTMVALSFAFIRDEVELATTATAAYFFASVPMGILGAVLGVRLSLRISDTAIFFFIGSVLILIGIALVVQSSLQS